MDKHFKYDGSHPGLRIAELLHNSSMTHGGLASRLSVSSYRLRTLLKGEKAIDMDLALKLACIFPEHTARDWLDMQTAHDLHQAYTSGKMDAIAREMGAETRNLPKAEWLVEMAKSSGSLRIPLCYPLNHMVAALAEKLDLPPQDIAVKAIRQLWQRMERGDSLDD